MSLARVVGMRKGRERAFWVLEKREGRARKKGGKRAPRLPSPSRAVPRPNSLSLPPRRLLCHRFYTFFLELLFPGSENSKEEIFKTYWTLFFSDCLKFLLFERLEMFKINLSIETKFWKEKSIVLLCVLMTFLSPEEGKKEKM